MPPYDCANNFSACLYEISDRSYDMISAFSFEDDINFKFDLIQLIICSIVSGSGALGVFSPHKMEGSAAFEGFVNLLGFFMKVLQCDESRRIDNELLVV
jgi:hypothetical protein